MLGLLILPALVSPKDACKRALASAAMFEGPNGAGLMKVVRMCQMSLFSSGLVSLPDIFLRFDYTSTIGFQIATLRSCSGSLES